MSNYERLEADRVPIERAEEGRTSESGQASVKHLRWLSAAHKLWHMPLSAIDVEVKEGYPVGSRVLPDTF